MRVSIRHRTAYGNSDPARRSAQYLRVTPRDSVSQTVLEWRVAAPGTLVPWADHFGNLCHTLSVAGPAEEIAIEAAGTIETVESDGILPFDDSELPLGVYARATDYTQADDRLRGFAERHRPALDDDPVAGLRALMIAVAEAVRFDRGSNGPRATAADALAEGAGAYQDHAHVFISSCRHLGFAARYVGGYLAPGGARYLAACHGWAEAAVPGLGWIGFDPANGRCPTDAYLRIAVGFDHAGAVPVRGIRGRGGEEDSTVEIAFDEPAARQQ